MKLSFQSIIIDTQQVLIGKTDSLSKTISTFLKDNTIDTKQIAKVDLFVDINNKEDFLNTDSNLQEVLSKVFGKQLPAYNITTCKNLTSSGTILLFTICNDKSCEIEHKEFQKFPYTLCSKEQSKTLLSGGIHFDEDNDLLRSTQMAFDFAEQLLDHEEMHFGHVDFLNAQIEKSFVTQTSNDSNSWRTVEQIKELYLDPELFNQNLPPLNLSTVNNGGITLSFSAAVKDTFPIHQVKTNPGISSSIAKEWQQAKFSTNKMVNENSNIISQIKEILNLIKETLSRDTGLGISQLKFDLLRIYLPNEVDFADAEMIIKQQCGANQYIFLQSELQQSEALIAIDGQVSF
ncbi:hypothetical protein [Carboxylicivirga linearis]|uniref:Uncharacterized protein n=1 Tax=Carboxylicivirga linearis TaxID=1628157 RepID=A0ABS5JPQ5_9BACT|nr:hypothetical protein [Carboxylicivirga linearis]MBS2096812.1 hypothetical protein [Carboxylicivirga linearis]